MSALGSATPQSFARFDAEGRLIEADDRLRSLNEEAGGAEGAPFAVPPIAAIVRLAYRLDIPIARQVAVADGDDDVELLVRAEPDADGVRLTVAGWRLHTTGDAVVMTARREADFLAADADWTWETDAQLRLRFVSRGADMADAIGAPITRLFTLGETEAGGVPMLEALAGHAPFDGQPAVVRTNGAAVTLSGSPMIDSVGRLVGFRGAARRVEANESPREGFGDIFGTRLDKALRLPLGRIVANADSIAERLDGPLAEEYADYASDIAAAGRHLLGLVDDLVDLQAIERPNFEARREEIDLADVAARAAGLLSVRSAEARVRIDRSGLGSALPASGEFRRALQVMVNLIGNAVRYSPEGSTVVLSGARDGDVVRVSVIDSGKGIAPEDQARIFEKFARVDPSEPGGSGLGLYISRRLARAMGGDISVESMPGEGAKFSFTLSVA
ncbi:sensor histidine kinase [Sphingomonas sp. AX6]|uniref:sensor histidine kinase n=1 Tax=Sphingomonas sp. AX6 TaxID=2653171 RepID=UPI0012F1DF3C|nr:HAMP domain-containing sensor histidine kinase [Sphingomonas sp. AX6]VXC93334.1 PAS domain-containing sensor histidine kinase [Sphingomonas sp. AX6]